MRYDAVLFDNDGVLTRPTASALVRAAVRATFREFGVEPTSEDVAAVVASDADRVTGLCDEYGIDADEYWTRREERAALAQRRAMQTGAKSLYPDVESLDELSVPLAVVSNNQHATIEHILEVFDVADRFEVVYGRDPDIRGIGRKKPSPHYLNRALEDLGADTALYVGDSNVDIIAAEEAGIDSAYVWRPHRREYSLTREPTYELDSLSELTEIVA